MRLCDRLPEGYVGVPLSVGRGSEGPIRPCVLAHANPEAAGGRFVSLSDALDARAWLGCVLDAAGRVLIWTRVVVQDVDGLAMEADVGDAGGGIGVAAGLSNGSLEERWRRSVRALEQAAPGEMVAVGWEDGPVPALALDPRKMALSELMHEASGDTYAVCRDDAALLARGLPTFSGSLDRYLWVPSLGDRSPMAAVTRGSPEGDTSLEEILTGVNRAFEPFNLRGGHVFVRRLHPLTLESLIDVVGGAAWSGVSHGTRAIMLDRGEVVTARGSSHGGETIDPDRLYLGRHGRWGRLVETLHLKLRLLTEAMSQTREVVARTGRPLFNITAEAFEADLHDAAAGLPRLWTAGVRLAHAGTALEIRLGGEGAGGAGFVVAPEDIGRGVYKPVLHAQATGGVASLLVRAVTTDGSLSTIESTLRSQERLAIGRSDLVALRLSVGGERVSLYAKIEEAAGLAAGEARLRTLPAELSARASEALSASQGVVIEGVRFDVLPSVSTPCDLHAMGVLCVRTLLVDGEQSLPMALDEVLSLATLAGEAGGATAAERIESVFMGDGRWAELLGPHRLVRERVGAQESLDLVPPDLWFETLGFVARLFPGRMAGAFARDLGDAPAKAAHRVFDAPLEELDHLLVRTRSLVVIDWKQNREVHGVLRRFQEGLDRAEAPVIPKLT